MAVPHKKYDQFLKQPRAHSNTMHSGIRSSAIPDPQSARAAPLLSLCLVNDASASTLAI
jgi:hypothetical protein